MCTWLPCVRGRCFARIAVRRCPTLLCIRRMPCTAWLVFNARACVLHRWGHAVVGSDRHSLLAFCCSLGCMRKVYNQTRWSRAQRQTELVSSQTVLEVRGHSFLCGIFTGGGLQHLRSQMAWLPNTQGIWCVRACGCLAARKSCGLAGL